MSRLTAIEIRNYRAYRGIFRLELPKGENLLVYGENGAGKSSLFYTLRTFLEAPDIRVLNNDVIYQLGMQQPTRPLLAEDNRHRFTTEPAGVKLEFGQRIYEWTKGKNETGEDAVRTLNKGKGFLDYKALLEVHYVRSGEKQEINLFQLILEHLLPHYTYSHQGTSRTFKDRWAELNKEVARTWQWTRRQKEPEKDFLLALEEFNQAFEKAINDLARRASLMLAIFGDEFQVDLRFHKAFFKRGPKRIDGAKVLALPAFRKLQCKDYHNFLNEARLSALAICLFLAAVKNSPATGLRLLALDDILIGLDMANRVKVVDLIQVHFKSNEITDWQIIILTYSKAWFERLKNHLQKSEAHPGWASVVLWEDWRGEDTSPYIIAEGSGDMIEMAEKHLKRKDYKAAAVYTRSALEALCHHTCAEAALPVLHVDSPKDRKMEHYWAVLKGRISEIFEDSRQSRALHLITSVEQAREFVLNRNSHFDVEEEDTLSGEVGAALDTVKSLKAFFETQSWANENFQSGRKVSATEQMQTHIVVARELAAKNATKQCQNSLKAAFVWFWHEYGHMLGVKLPIGSELTTETIWKAAKDENLIPAGVTTKLDANKAYLYGSVKGGKFDPAKFETAVKVLEELCPSPVAAPPAPVIAP